MISLGVGLNFSALRSSMHTSTINMHLLYGQLLLNKHAIVKVQGHVTIFIGQPMYMWCLHDDGGNVPHSMRQH